MASADSATLLDDITTYELPGIVSLEAQTQSATTCPALVQLRLSMYRDYHVYLVMTPQTQLTIAADEDLYLESALTAHAPTAAQLGASLSSTTSQASGALILADLQSHLAAAQSLTNGLVSTLLQLTPQGWPGNQPTLSSAWKTVTTARQHLSVVQRDLDEIRHLPK